jgi:uncharacterized protein YjiS (DUF1127 family)
MSAQITKDQFTFSLGNASYVDYSVTTSPPATVVKPRRSSIGHWLRLAVSAFADWRRRQAVMQEMAMLSDRELADIGLSRVDLPRVFDPTFAAEHVRGRDYLAY